LAAVSGPDTVSTEANKPAETVVDPVAVTVNGVDINESQIEAQLKPQLQKMAAQLPPAFIEQYKKQLRQQILEKMIIEQLLDEKVKAAKIVTTANDVNNLILEMAAAEKLSMDDFKGLIEATGRSFEQWKQQWMQQMQIEKRLGYQKLMEAQWVGKVNVKKEDAKKYYSENKSKYETPEQVRASHILITPDTNDPNQAKAQDLLKRIKGGADFAELARANSDCPSSAKGGDLGFGERSDPNSDKRGTWVVPFEKAAFELNVGQVSNIVETQFGYHIIKVTDHKDASVITFEQAKDDIIKLLTQTKQAELAEEYIESLKNNATIVYPAGKEPTVPTSPKSTPEPEDKTEVE